ncbi:phosphoribosylanthranilate isomerase [Luteirhabdus pelagi]|uniref:phosphoribosylanthranilate isomerase n=1 Tax=Luteirhabdus pelagi TaxID=2792783 RepID=UPI00193A7C3D|nr:phosphoribosylanthranilate isomerase [Luteirhabdus pelagi]
MKLKVKVCGIKYNTKAVADLQPDYLGFIFYEGSPRYVEKTDSAIPDFIKKVGVFVQEKIEKIANIVAANELEVVQLHGKEDIKYAEVLRKQIPKQVKIWKVFHIGNEFDFDQLAPFEPFVDAFLFDTKSEALGGSGKRFSWQVLQQYPSKKPIILSGGIGEEHLSELKAFIAQDRIPIHAIDVNSKFETRPGHKDTNALKRFIDEISS